MAAQFTGAVAVRTRESRGGDRLDVMGRANTPEPFAGADHQQLESVMAGRCPHCGTTLPQVVDAFCPECRRPLDEPPDRAGPGERPGSRSGHADPTTRFVEGAGPPARLTLSRGDDPTPHVPKQPVHRSTPQRAKGEISYQESPLFIPGQDDGWLRYRPGTTFDRLRDAAKSAGWLAVGAAAAVVVVVTGLLLAIASRKHVGENHASYAIIFSTLLAAACVIRGTGRHVANRISRRRPVVFLRSHFDDGVEVRKGWLDQEPSFSPHNRPGGWGRAQMPVEEVLHEELKHVGPTFSITPPSELEASKVSVFHFYRYDVPMADWQKAVLEQLCKARLVVLLLPFEKSLADPRWGVGWELDTLRKIDRPEKVLLVVPPYTDDVIAGRWKALRAFVDRIGISLPEPPPAAGDLCLFDQGWRATVVRHTDRQTVGGLRKNLRRTVIDPELTYRRVRRGLVVGLTAFALAAGLLFGLGPTDFPRTSLLVVFGLVCGLIGLAAGLSRSGF